jgi:Flp pilus assembly protein TadD
LSFTITLDNFYKRIAALLTVAVVGLGLAWLVVSNFIVRGLADRRVDYPREWLVAAVERFPNSARINYRLADAEFSAGSGTGQYDAQAESHALQAVNSSPWDYRSRQLLANAQELNGKLEEAENSLRAAVRLAPNYAELNSSFANLLVRRGKLDESLAPFRVAARAKVGLLASTVETVWRSSGKNLETLKTFAGNDPELSLAVVKFLVEQNLNVEAVQIFNSIDKQAKVNSPQSSELIATLWRMGEFNLARSTWVELMASRQPGGEKNGGEIWNGGFETDSVENLDQFNWAIRPNQYARIFIDRSFARTGARSLKVAFSGRDTTTLKDQVQQTIVLRPGARYRLECYAMARDFVSPEGPRIAVFGQGGMIASSAPVIADTSDWQRLSVEFVAPANSPLAVLAILRTPKFSYDDPTRGTIWFDDFSLVEL